MSWRSVPRLLSIACILSNSGISSSKSFLALTARVAYFAALVLICRSNSWYSAVTSPGVFDSRHVSPIGWIGVAGGILVVIAFVLISFYCFLPGTFTHLFW